MSERATGMNEQMYSAEEAAQILGLQVRTVRSYLREGRLPGVRIGKQYRIARRDLEAFTGGGAARGAAHASLAPVSQPVLPAATVEVSSVLQVDGAAPGLADRVTRTLAAAVAGRSASDPELRVEPLYDEQRARLKIIIVGKSRDSVELIRIVEALVPDDT